MIQNFSVFDFTLDDGEMDAIKALDTKTTAFFNHRDPRVGGAAEHPQA